MPFTDINHLPATTWLDHLSHVAAIATPGAHGLCANSQSVPRDYILSVEARGQRKNSEG